MFDKFWEKLGQELAGRWGSQTLGPMLAFWGGGVLAWLYRQGWDWQQLEQDLASIDNPAAYVGLAVGGLFVLLASSSVVSWLQRPVLRLLEGYWPGPFRGLRFRLARWRAKRLAKKETRWQALADVPPERRSAEQQSEYADLDAELAHYPVDSRRLMPTALGNLLRSAEEYPQVRYGLGMSVCWPRMWLVVPKETRETLAQAQQQLNSAVRCFSGARCSSCGPHLPGGWFSRRCSSRQPLTGRRSRRLARTAISCARPSTCTASRSMNRPTGLSRRRPLARRPTARRSALIYSGARSAATCASPITVRNRTDFLSPVSTGT